MASRLVLKVERVKVLKVRSGVRVGESYGPCGTPRNPIVPMPSDDLPDVVPSVMGIAGAV